MATRRHAPAEKNTRTSSRPRAKKVTKRNPNKPEDRMSEHADIVAVQYPRGVMALVWLDLSTGAIATTHAGLRHTLRCELRNWAGQVVTPHDGQAFLSAVYDHFFLNGYRVHWLSVSGLNSIRHTYRV
ncbi:MAG: hypothetical protein KF751_15310 [Nitrospira sp.]|nr:hypothetical protein [Nitrospira sp.]